MDKKMKILIGYDGSENADAILEDLAKAGLPEFVEAIVLTVAEAWEPPFIADGISAAAVGSFDYPNLASINSQFEQVVDMSKKVAETFAKQIRKNFPGWRVFGESICRKPAVGLIEKADELKPDLLVVGSQGRSAIGRFILGSVSQKVLHEALCSVRVSRQSAKAGGSKVRVLVGVDGSAHSEQIIEEIRRRNWNAEYEFRLIGVNDPFTRPEAGYLPWDIKEDKPIENEKSKLWLEKVLNAPAEILKSAGLEVSQVIKWGDPANVILHEAKEWDADSIILGARGLGRVKRFLLGSVSSTVAAKAMCSVEVIRETSV